MTDPREAYRNFKEDQVRMVREPKKIEEIRQDVKKDYVCKFCGASRRAQVIYRPDLSNARELVVEIECRAFVKGEMCGDVETRYYSA